MRGPDLIERLPGFVGGKLDRADQVRVNPLLLAEAFTSPEARQVLLDGLDPIERDGRLAREPLEPGASLEDYALLGVDPEQGPLFVRLNAKGQGAFATDRARALVSQVPPEEAAIYATARSLVFWHARHGFCSVCGQPSEPEKGGWARRCGGCGAEHFPRVDPVVIMLAEHRGRVLLGRQHGWPEGRYSALAGFVEPGETIEEAVAREIWEEAGVKVHDVRYIMSQPWPFPSSLMFACIGQAEDDALTLDEAEIEHAFWCDLESARAAMTGDPSAPFLAPPRLAVAWHLLNHWIEGRLVPATPTA